MNDYEEEITDADCKIVDGEWRNGRCYPKKAKHKFTVSYRRASGDVEKIQQVPSMFLDEFVKTIEEHGGVYDVQVDGLPYYKHFEIHGGIFNEEFQKIQEKSRKSFLQMDSHGHWKSHKFIKAGTGRDD